MNVRSAKTSATLAFLLLALGAVFSSCGGYSTEDAEAWCDQELEAREASGCFNPSTYENCVTAHEECGDDAVPNDGCPLEYECLE